MTTATVERAQTAEMVNEMDRELTAWLQAVMDRAGIEAGQAREETGERADVDITIRAWERLQDAADGLHARHARRAAYATHFAKHGPPVART